MLIQERHKLELLKAAHITREALSSCHFEFIKETNIFHLNGRQVCVRPYYSFLFPRSPHVTWKVHVPQHSCSLWTYCSWKPQPKNTSHYLFNLCLVENVIYMFYLTVCFLLSGSAHTRSSTLRRVLTNLYCWGRGGWRRLRRTPASFSFRPTTSSSSTTRPERLWLLR